MTATAATSAARAEASRINGRKSMGPRSFEGKCRVRLNAIKHGMTATTVVLPGEDAARLDARVAAWKQDVQPQTTMEDYLVERAAHVSWQLDRADRTIAARLTGLIADAPLDQAVREADQVADLAFRLFWHPRGPIALYPHFPQLSVTPRTSRPETVENALNPARIVNRLEALPAGCQWLLDRWAELAKLLDDGLKWQPPDRLRAIRLLGRQPTDALDDERVLSIYLACNAMDPGGPSSFGDVVHEMDDAELKAFAERIAGRRAQERQPAGPAAGQAALRAIIEQAVTRLQALVAGHRERQALSLPAWLDGQAFDNSAEGERMRRYQQTHSRALNSTIQTLFKVRKELGERTEDPADDVGVTGVEAPVGDASALATMEPIRPRSERGCQRAFQRACVAGLRPQPRERARKRRCGGRGRGRAGRREPGRVGAGDVRSVRSPRSLRRNPGGSAGRAFRQNEPEAGRWAFRQNKPRAGRAPVDRRAGCRSGSVCGSGR